MSKTVPATMRGVVVEGGKGPAEALRLATLPTPQPAPGEILVAVRAAGVNRPDLLQRLGAYPPPPGAPDTLGLEAAGEVVRPAGRWRAGDRVCVLLGGGGYASYVACDARHALPVPQGLDLVQAAAVPEAVFTVYANVFEAGALKPGETFLVHGATSGIGVAAIQMAKAAGVKVIATGRGADKAAAARSLGADVAVDTTAEDFGAVCQREGGVDVVLDMVGGDYVPTALDALKAGGRIVFIAHLGGSEARLSIRKVMQKRAVITGSTLRPRDADEKARLAAAVERVVWPWIVAGQVKPRVDATYPLAEAAKAHARLESGSHVGKVVLTVD